jgi:hypothetical protein
MTQFPTRSLRLVLALATIVATMVPFLAAAEGDEPILALAPGAAVLEVGLPTANAMISNGQMVDIGGWTTGSRVDAYLDGPAGTGRGIGSTSVDRSRPDVARATGSSALGSSGWDISWQPTDLTAGPHTLWIYSYVNGAWTVQVVQITAEGNGLIQPRDRDHDRDMDTNEQVNADPTPE